MALAALGVLVLAFATAVLPVITVVLTVAGSAVVLGWAWRGRWVPYLRRNGVTVGATLASVLGATALSVVAAGWPALLLVALAAAIVLALAWRAPAWAFAAGILLIAFEGTVKILLRFDAVSLPGTSRVIGAAAIDLALFGAIAGVLLADRLRTPRRLWAAASRGERVALGLVGAWLAISVLQIAQSGDLQRGLEGFRLFQAYVAAGVAAAVIAGRLRRLDGLLTAALAIGFLVSAYAAFRVAVGPAAAEREFAGTVASTVAYDGILRTVGSFSSSIGMTSFLTPLVIVAIVSGYLLPRFRVAAWATAALALVGILGSYGRGPLFGIVVGLLFALAVIVASGDLSPRRKVLAGALVASTILATLGGVYVASRGSDPLRERARGVVLPVGDESVQMRFDTWRRLIGTVDEHPLGRGLGTVGSASADDRAELTTADNSFLKLLVEQGIPGTALFLAGILGAIVLLGRRLTRLGGERRAAGLAALAGFVGFLALATTGEYVEQPGKAAAWSLLGIAIAAALAPTPSEDGSP